MACNNAAASTADMFTIAKAIGETERCVVVRLLPATLSVCCLPLVGIWPTRGQERAGEEMSPAEIFNGGPFIIPAFRMLAFRIHAHVAASQTCSRRS